MFQKMDDGKDVLIFVMSVYEFAKTCPDALVERALPDLLAFFDRETQWSDERAAVLEALEAIGRPALPALKKLVEPYAADSAREIREVIRRIENTE